MQHIEKKKKHKKNMKRTVSNASQIVTPSDAHGGPLWLPLGNDKAPHGLHLNRAKFPTKRVWQLRSMRWTVRAEIHELHLPHLPVVVNVHIVHRTSFIILPRSWYVRKQKEELHNQLKCCQWHKFQQVTQNAMRTKKRRSFCILRHLLTGAPPKPPAAQSKALEPWWSRVPISHPSEINIFNVSKSPSLAAPQGTLKSQILLSKRDFRLYQWTKDKLDDLNLNLSNRPMVCSFLFLLFLLFFCSVDGSNSRNLCPTEMLLRSKDQCPTFAAFASCLFSRQSRHSQDLKSSWKEPRNISTISRVLTCSSAKIPEKPPKTPIGR